jgi:hypothetical protein
MRGRLESRDTNNKPSSSVKENRATQDNRTVPSTSVSPSRDRRHERSAAMVSCHALANLPHPSPLIQPHSTTPLSPSDTVQCGSPNHEHSSPTSTPTPTSPRRKNWFVSNCFHVFDVRRWRVSRGDRREVHWLKPTLSLLFAVTTPFGIALGMAVWGDRDEGVSDRGMSVIRLGISHT